MNNTGTRKPLSREPIHPHLVEAAALASPPKRLEPAVRNLGPEHVERLDVGRYAAGADAVQRFETKANALLAQANAYRELSSSLSHQDALSPALISVAE
jgi:hypothetical protein